MQEKFGVVLEAITSGFENKMNKVKSVTDDTRVKIAQLKDTIKESQANMNNFDIGSDKWLKYARSVDSAKQELKDLQNTQKRTKSGSSSLGSIISSLQSKFKSLGSGTRDITKSIEKMANKAKTSFKKMVMGIISVRSAFFAMRKAVSSYLAFDAKLSDTLSDAWAGLGAQLAPIIELIINLFARAISYINMFIKALTGIDMVARANTKALNSQTSAAKATVKALTSLDEITNIDNGSGAGGGAGDFNEITLPDVSMNDFLENLRKQIEEGNWYGIGETIAKKLNETLDRIDWEKIRTKAQNVGRNIALFLNGGIENTDWQLVGSTIANGLNTAIDFLNSFVSTFNFKATGEAVANSINGFFETTDWSKVGDTISKSIAGALDFGIGFFEKLDGKKVGESLEKTLDKIDWDAFGEKLSDLIAEAIPDLFDIGKSLVKSLILGFEDGLTSFVTTSNKKLNKKLEELGDKLEENAGDIALKLIDGLIDGIAKQDFGILLKPVLFDPFMKAVKKLFGIHSPSTVMAEIGSYLTDGLSNGIGNIWNKVSSKFEDFKNKTRNKLNEISQMKCDITANIKGNISDFKTKMKKVFGNNDILNSIFNWGASKISQAKNWLASLDTGTNYVPEDQLAYIHKGEAVVPKKFNSAEYFSNINNNEETNDLLIEVNRNLLTLIDKDTSIKINGKELAQATYKDFQNEGNRLGQSSVVSVR